MKNGHQTHQTLILLITMSGELCLNATTQAKYYRRAEESLANNTFLFLLQDSLYGFPILFTVTSEHIRLFTF